MASSVTNGESAIQGPSPVAQQFCPARSLPIRWSRVLSPYGVQFNGTSLLQRNESVEIGGSENGN